MSMNKLAKAIVKLKWPIIIVVIALTIFLGYQIKNLKIDSDVINSLPDDDQVSVLYKKIGKQYGGNTMGMVVLETDNVFTKDVLEHIKDDKQAICLLSKFADWQSFSVPKPEDTK